MKSTLWLLSIIFILLFSTAKAQWEPGVAIGASGYMGEMNSRNPFKFTDLAGGIYLRYNFSDFFAFRGSLMIGKIQGNDSTSNFTYNKKRNLSFTSSIEELGTQLEFNFFRYQPGSKDYRFTPYVFTGFNIFRFNPKATYQGKEYELQKLGTEGQGTTLNKEGKYSLVNFSIPYGVGIKYNFLDNYTFNVEAGYRSTATDYLDDVGRTYVDKVLLAQKNGSIAALLSDRSGELSDGVYSGIPQTQRGDLKKKDNYMFATIGISYTFVRVRCPGISNFRKIQKLK